MSKNKQKLTIDDFTKKIIHWIEVNIDKQLTLDDLASRIGYSKRMIQLHFKEKYGMTIGAYILNRRLYRSCVLLRMTTLSISEIAYLLHYDNHHNFCRAFKKKVHYSPLAFRNLPLEKLPSIPLPQINYTAPISYAFMEFKNKTIDGINLRYNDEIKNPNSSGGIIRLQRIQAWFRDNQSPLTIASDVLRQNSLAQGRMGIITVSAYMGQLIDSSLASSTNIVPHIDGMYLRCDFDGYFDSYVSHNKEIYSHLLSKLGLKRRDVCDVEIFHFSPHVFDDLPKVICEHYIPIIQK